MERGAWEGVSAVITAGGQSRRFGTDKALALLGGVSLLERVAGSLQMADGKWLIAPKGKYRLLGWTIMPDLRPDEGPLAGLETALMHAEGGWVAFAGVDMPSLTAEYWESLLKAREPGKLAVQALDAGNRPQPLAALYHTDLLPQISTLLDQGERRLRQAAPPESTVLVSGLPERFFLNVNRPEDLSIT